jgi:hypothetical protein
MAAMPRTEKPIIHTPKITAKNFDLPGAKGISGRIM